MIKTGILCLLLCVISLSGFAQQNLYQSNGVGNFRGWPVIEYGSHVYYLTTGTDPSSSAVVTNYYFSQVNKHSYKLERSVVVFRDTSYLIGEPRTNGLHISYTLNANTKKFSFFFVIDADSFQYESSPLRQFPRSIWLKQLDTALNTVTDNRPVLHSDRNGRYVISDIELPEIGPDNRMVLNYQVFDTTLPPDLIEESFANKLLVVDDTGKVLRDEFLGKEPDGFARPYAISITGKVYSLKDGTYAAIVGYTDSMTWGSHTLLILDSNMRTVHAMDYPADRYTGPHPTDKHIFFFGAFQESVLVLPGGSFVRSAFAACGDTLGSKWYVSNALVRAEVGAGYQNKQAYVPPRSNSLDESHALMGSGFKSITSRPVMYEAIAFNSYDQGIYTFSSTESDQGEYCINGQPNLGQIAALDTNLNEKWVKYVRPAAGRCIVGTSVSASHGRSGAVVAGWEAEVNDWFSIFSWRPFIYHIDSTTELGLDVNSPASPVIISGQFTLYPNPAANHIFIENILGTPFGYSIINSIGQVVAAGKGEGIRTQAGLDGLPAGIYMVQIRTADQKNYALKFLKGQGK